MLNKFVTDSTLPPTGAVHYPAPPLVREMPPTAVLDGVVLVCEAWQSFASEAQRQQWGLAALRRYSAGLVPSPYCRIEPIFGRRGDDTAVQEAMRELLLHYLPQAGLDSRPATVACFVVEVNGVRVWGVAAVRVGREVVG